MKIPNRTSNCENGFSLIELIVSIVILGILSYVVVANMETTHTKLQYESMTRKILSDVRYARELALTEGKGSRIYIDVLNNRYYLKWVDGSYIQNPIGGGNFVVQLGQGLFSAVHITSTSFSSGWLDFGASGIPKNTGSPFSGELNLIALNNEKKITVTGSTGFLRIEDL